MPEDFKTAIDRLSSCEQAPPPPPAFLRAVARRRRQRRLLQTGAACLVLLAAAIPSIMLLRGQPTASPSGPAAPRPQVASSPAAPAVWPTAFALLQMNADFDEKSLVLPAPEGSFPEHADLRPARAWDREAIERLLRN
jgi:hypothetical protein